MTAPARATGTSSFSTRRSPATSSSCTRGSTRVTATTTWTRMSTTFDGAYLLTAKGTARSADRHSCCRRRRSHLRRRRRVSSLRRDGLGIQHLRGPHDPQHRGRILGRREGRGGREGTDGPQLPDRERRHRRERAVRRIEGLLHRRQRLSRPRRPPSRARLGESRVSTAPIRSTATTRSRSTARAT